LVSGGSAERRASAAAGSGSAPDAGGSQLQTSVRLFVGSQHPPDFLH
jgi:hypothetical protein